MQNNYKPYIDPIAKNQAASVQLLKHWASINSGSHNLKGLDSILDALYSLFSTLPAKIEKLPLAIDPLIPKALHLSCRPHAPLQVYFNGHMDTVYPKEHSFQNCTLIDKNTLQGPGVTDMKGGLVVMFEALKAFESSPWTNNLGWEILIVPDEEIGSPHSSDFLKNAVKTHNFALAFEPALSDGALARSRKGSGTFQFTATGKAAHAGRNFNSGINAIVALNEFLLKIHSLNTQFPGSLFNIGYIEGGGPINVVPDHALAKINIRITQPEDQHFIIKHIQKLTTEFNASHQAQIAFSGNISRPPKPPSPASEFLYQEFLACASTLNIPLGWEDSAGASDGCFLAVSGLPNIDNLGARGNNIHSNQEFIYLDSLTERAQLTALFLMKLGSGDIKLPQNLFPNLL